MSNFRFRKEHLIGRLVTKLFDRVPSVQSSCASFTIADVWAALRVYRKQPLISILIPVYNTDPVTLKNCIDSVLQQTYRKWELCIVDDASTDPHVRTILLAYALNDQRIKLVYAKTNVGIAATINSAARLATGQYIGVLDHDDELAPETLSEYVRCIDHTPDVAVIYCDEDKIDENGDRCDSWYKSDWNPDLLLSFNYVMHFVLYRRALFQQVGGVRQAYEGSQDYDLLLRISETTEKIDHIPKVLYHWRMGKGSIASGPAAKPDVFVSGLAALQAALDRRGIAGTAVDAPDAWKGVYRVRRRIDPNLSCSVVIAAYDDPKALARLLSSIRENLHPSVVEIIVFTAGDIEILTRSLDGFDALPIQAVATSGSHASDGFNQGSDRARGDLLLFLDETFEIRSSGSIAALIEQAQRQEVGAAGGKVYYGDGLLEHGGVIFGPFNLIGYAHRATPEGFGYAGLKNMIGNYSAVMGLGMMTRRSLFEELGGFDPAFTKAYWDADYCLRLRDRNCLVTYTPYATFTHHIPVPTIDQMIVEPDAGLFKQRWQPGDRP